MKVTINNQTTREDWYRITGKEEARGLVSDVFCGFIGKSFCLDEAVHNFGDVIYNIKEERWAIKHNSKAFNRKSHRKSVRMKND